MCYELEIHPRDVLYFRDGRPIGSSAEGSGAMWPSPSLFHSALLSALHGELGNNIKQWESSHEHLTEKELKRQKDGRGLKVRYNFGGLKTWGPFPKNDGNIYVPTPADLLAVDDEQKNDETIRYTNGVMTPLELPEQGINNLPKPLKYSVGSLGKPSKKKPGEWISLNELSKYLDGKPVKPETVTASKLYSSEARPGIGIDPKTGTTEKSKFYLDSGADSLTSHDFPKTGTTEKSKFYSAEYLRLTEGTSMVAFAQCTAKKYDGTETDVLKEFFRPASQASFLFGGQRGVAYLECNRKKNNFPDATVKNIQLKWVLLTPAYFSAGWLPGWVDQNNGNVLLKENKQKSVNAQLVAALVAKPTAISGWSVASGKPKATRLLVPAGSVYYFKCANVEDAERLCRILHGKTKSDMLGEQGFGFGVCGTWNFNHFDQN
ncbi:MAG: type III-B CRISPR module-associated Cmr3 family protein [Victivallaceae bacterium]|nr:type III-B CRISPR module-associated Cmr3 family protein [Victivallaceae bacterium]